MLQGEKGDFPMPDQEKKLGLYIHIPFCKAKCNYCDFNSYSGLEALVIPYFKALEHEIACWSPLIKNNSITSVFIGGGTPSLVEPQLITRLMDSCRNAFNIISSAEITIESNPGTLTPEKLKAYRRSGINRLSMGVQACQDRLLRLMGRIHSVSEFDENFKHALDAGFDNINLDLIFGLPGQTREEWRETLEYAVRPGVTHLSCYSLKIEEGTVFEKRVESGELLPLEDELDRQMYADARDILSHKGFGHYEISNFALPGYECRHNLIYWRAEEYLGIGAGAHSYVNGRRFNNIYGVRQYIDNSGSFEKLQENFQAIDRQESMSEYMMLGFRLIGGVNSRDFEARYGESLKKVFGEKLERLLKMELIERQADNFRLTEYGLDIANRVFAEFV